MNVWDEEWHGLERGSDSWVESQIKGLTDKLLDGDIDVKGLRAYLMEMANKNAGDLIKFLALILLHLLFLRYARGVYFLQNKQHWNDEIDSYRNEVDSIIGITVKGKHLNADLCSTYRDDVEQNTYAMAKTRFKNKYKKEHISEKDYEKIKNFSFDFTIEDLWQGNIDDLLERLP